MTRCSRAHSRQASGRRGASGPFGGRSSASPLFSGSLNFSQSQDGEAPAIDFAGAGRIVPWATWYENTTGTGFANNNVFASRFDNTGDANQNKWIFAGQSRGTGGGSVPVPSLNIHTNRDAENPSVAGESAVDPTKPGPWITWQETTTLPVSGKDQIFVEPPIGLAAMIATASSRRAFGGRSRAGDRRVLLAGDRDPTRRTFNGGPESERRPDAQRDRARHRVHRPQRRRSVGRLVRDRVTNHQRPAHQRDGVRRQGRQ